VTPAIGPLLHGLAAAVPPLLALLGALALLAVLARAMPGLRQRGYDRVAARERVRLVVELPAQPSRDDAYAAANDRLLDGVDVLIAVWDGKGAQGHGGTAEVVGRARASHLPVAWVHAGNRKPGTMEPTSLGADQGKVTYENL